jgi:hypothetical protein
MSEKLKAVGELLSHALVLRDPEQHIRHPAIKALAVYERASDTVWLGQVTLQPKPLVNYHVHKPGEDALGIIRTSHEPISAFCSKLPLYADKYSSIELSALVWTNELSIAQLTTLRDYLFWDPNGRHTLRAFIQHNEKAFIPYDPFEL